MQKLKLTALYEVQGATMNVYSIALSFNRYSAFLCFVVHGSSVQSSIRVTGQHQTALSRDAYPACEIAPEDGWVDSSSRLTGKMDYLWRVPYASIRHLFHDIRLRFDPILQTFKVQISVDSTWTTIHCCDLAATPIAVLKIYQRGSLRARMIGSLTP